MSIVSEKNAEREEAKAINDAINNPQNYCQICWKKIGVCKHTRKLSKALQSEE